jgi:hypothetical protein
VATNLEGFVLGGPGVLIALAVLAVGAGAGYGLAVAVAHSAGLPLAPPAWARLSEPGPLSVAGRARCFDSNIVLFGRVGKDKKTIGNVSFWWDLRLVRRGKQREATTTSFTVVDPGKAQVVFKDGLNELLIERKESGWTWEA